jgi:hypothetical protein
MVTTEEVLAVVARSPSTFGAERRPWLEAELAKLGGSDEVVSAALVAVSDGDRNVRVRALWALWLFPDDRATAAVLAALSDPVRRVREVAMKVAAPHHVASPEVVARLQAIAESEAEVGRLRRLAFFVLSSWATRVALPDVAEGAMLSLLSGEQFRTPILVRLCKATTQTPASRAVLHEIVRTGTKEEAVMATRALAGQVLVRVDGWLPADVRQRVRDAYDPCPEAPALLGAGWPESRWVPVDDALEYAREVGFTSVTSVP